MNHSSAETNAKFKKILNQLQKYKRESKQLKQQLDDFKSQISFKNQLLDEKSKHIISCTSENIALRKEIQLLQKKLELLQNKKKKSTKKSKRQKSKNGSAQLKLILQDKQLSLDTKNLSFVSTDEEHINEHVNEHKLNIENNISTQSNQMPYLIMPDMVTSISAASNGSNLSLQACELTLPNTQPSIDSNISDSDSHTLITLESSKPSINININSSVLKPIAENNENSQFTNDQYTFSPITPITPIINESNNNKNIHVNEWSDSFATIVPIIIEGNNNKNVPGNNASKMKDIYDDGDDGVSVLSFTGSHRRSNYYNEMDNDDGDIDDESDASGNTNLIYLDYSDRDTDNELPHIKPYNTNVLNPNINENENDKYHFPNAISVLSDLTGTDLTDNDTDGIYISN